VGGGVLAPTADTQVFVPRRQYPTGYDVDVEGGEPVSAPNEQALRIRTCSGRARVSVRVGPGLGAISADCRAPRVSARRRLKIRLRAAPRRVRTGRRTRFRFRATVRGRALRGATVKFGRHRKRTDRRGRALMRVNVRHSGPHGARASRRGYRAGRTTIRAVRRRQASRRRQPVFTG
jgi:endoglycosylceramidase